MKKSMRILSLLVLASMVLLPACQTASPPTQAQPTEAPAVQPTEAPAMQPTEAMADPMAALVDAAKAEGEIVSYGLPDDWVNYGGMWSLYESKYGIQHLDTDMGSGEIIAALEAEKTTGVADITDLGINFANQVVVEGLSQPYQELALG